jgi:uncharacterized membrane-anchored protein YjiN (DUF445 family)
MPEVAVSKLNALIVETIIDEVLTKLNKDDDLKNIQQNKVLLYLITVVLEQTKESLKDHKITSDDRVKLITDVVCVLIERLPLSEPLKKVLKCFINDGEIQKLLEELDNKITSKCMNWFGVVFRACARSNRK